eukprot:CAMPEP_0117586308 /NCGR_PEP_ID=MMETSP0784-20121206/68652_1 /TAXON_ID=39447 /ORGANISM="" /LENGTH=73 /DNA_ID=CAMNT_0005387399 /DNA_START=39 /DNA_END=257 /DNA_ORIENTATION=+
MSACKQGRRWEQVAVSLEDARAGELRPDVISCSTAISACCGSRIPSSRRESWTWAMGLVRKMAAWALQPDAPS